MSTDIVTFDKGHAERLGQVFCYCGLACSRGSREEDDVFLLSRHICLAVMRRQEKSLSVAAEASVEVGDVEIGCLCEKKVMPAMSLSHTAIIGALRPR